MISCIGMSFEKKKKNVKQKRKKNPRSLQESAMEIALWEKRKDNVI